LIFIIQNGIPRLCGNGNIVTEGLGGHLNLSVAY
jgi:hypothetical protein